MLLSIEEIQTIQNEVKTNIQWQFPNVMGIGHGQVRTSILCLSPVHKLIIFQGDINTGFEHIRQRHSYWSTKSFFKPSEDGLKVDNPTKFGRKSMPIMDYQDIIDQLFNPENVGSKNNEPELFDVYKGDVKSENNEDGIYTMVLYKGTKILHALYPNKKVNNHTKKGNKPLKYAKGKPQYTIDTNPFVVSIGVPYRDNKGKVFYSVEIFRDYDKKIEVALVRDHRKDGHFQLYEEELTKEFDQHSLRTEVEFLQFQDFTKVEKMIKKYDKENYNLDKSHNKK